MSDAHEAELRSQDIDSHIGARVRLRRRMQAISQGWLAEQLGVTFHQVQKYERGHNRISASTLYAIAQALGAPLGFFFEGLPHSRPAGESRSAAPALPAELFNSLEWIELATVFPRLRRRHRQAFLDLVKVLARTEGEAGSGPGVGAAENVPLVRETGGR